jgi:hypothetical protein
MPEPEKSASEPVRAATLAVPMSLVDDVAAGVREAPVVYNDPALAPESSDQFNEVPDELLQFWQSLV